MSRRAALAALAALALAAGAERSDASFGGGNGLLALTAGDVWTVGSDGRGLRALTRNPVPERAPAWSPGGDRLAFERGGWIYALDRGSRTTQRVARGADPSWSPDGSRLVVRGSDGLYALRADGSGRRRLRAGPAHSPRWAPDGSLVAFLERGRALVMRADGLSGRALPEPGCGGAPTALDWSPDASRLAVLTERCLVLADVAGGALEELPDRGGEAVAWSPDGRRLAVVGGGKVRLLALDGKLLREFGARRGATGLDWQPRCTISGTARGERLGGSPGDDFLCSGAGDDVLAGHDGRDRIFAGTGNDYVLSADGFADVVGCGPGLDEVLADRADLVGVDCERVRRT